MNDEQKTVEEEEKKIDIVDAEGKVIGDMSVEEANEVVTDLLVDGVHFENVEVLGVKFKLKTLTKGARAALVKKISDMEDSGMVVQDELVTLNLSNSLVEADGNTVKNVEDAYELLVSLEEHVFDKLYDEYLKLMFKVQAAINNPDAPKN